MATYQEAYNRSLEYFNGDELAADVFVTKYALTDSQGDIKELTPDDMHRRMAKEFARIEKKYKHPLDEEIIYDLFKYFNYIIPQGSPMSAIGNDYQIQSVSNCFVIDSAHDSYGGILRTDEEEVQLMKRRAGVGHDSISNIRPKGIATKNAARTTDGIGVFMQRYSNSCREVAQDGRRGALMLTCNVHHPEIKTFINIKRDKKKVTGANISVKITDEFMNAVINDTSYEQKFPIYNAKYINTVSAKEIWMNIIESAWESAEPGVLFWDTIKKYTPSDIYKDFGFSSVSTNPCGEIILSPYDSCRLLSLNLYSYVNKPFIKEAKFDWILYNKHVIIAQKLMDDLVDLELEQIDKILNKIKNDPEPEDIKNTEYNLWLKIKSSCEKGRRTGLGITALGDCLAALGIQYGSKESIEMTENIYKQLALGSYTSSILMARDRGKFPICDYKLEKDHIFINNIMLNLDDDIVDIYKKYGRRNIANLTTAPTGTVSIMTQTSSGIEPVYNLSYKRRKKINAGENVVPDFIDESGDKWSEYNVYHHKLKQWMAITGETDITKSPYHNSTAYDIDWLASVEIQSRAQKWIDHSISKTCNLPKDVTKEQVSELYIKAWQLGCKGFTIYRQGSRDGVLIEEEENKNESFIEHSAPKRPKELSCDIHQVSIKGEAWTVFVGKYENKPYEIFGGLSKYISIPKKYKQGKLVKSTKKTNGSSAYDIFYGEGEDTTKIHDIVDVFENPTHGAFTRTISLSLRHGCPVHYLVEQLQKDDKESDMYSFSKVMARVLKHYIEDGIKHSKGCGNPDCKSQDSLEYKEGCLTCMSCGWSKCS